MGWCAIEFCNDIYLIVKDEVAKKKQKEIAKKIYERFLEEDMDDCCGDSEIEKILEINENEDK